MKRVVVVGGGLSGLAAARVILDEAEKRSAPVSLTLLEKDPVLGGKIRSTREEGFLCEHGPNGFLDNKPATLALARRLGIEGRLLKSNDRARKRFVFTGGQLRQLPEDPVSFLLSDILSIRGKLRLAAEFLLPQGDPAADETVAAFVRRRLGDEALEKLIDPMSAGIYAGDPNVMSLRSCFPKVAQIEAQFGGLLKGMLAMQKMAKAMGKQGPQGAGPGGVLWSLKEGGGELIAELAESLGAEAVRPGVGAESLERPEPGGGRWRVRTTDGALLEADAVVLAVPAYDAARLLRGYDEKLGEVLYNIPYVPAAVVCLGFRRADLTHPLDGFGFLIPSGEGRRILGSLWSSSIFDLRAPEGMVLLTQIVGGARNPELVGLPDGDLQRVVRDELAWTLGVQSEPTFTRIIRWPRAIPQYVVGHNARLREVEARVAAFGGLWLGGNAYHGIGINDCTAQAQILGPRVADALVGPGGAP